MDRSEYDKIVMNHYSSVAKEDGISSLSTMKDEYIRNKETEAIVSFVNTIEVEKNRPLSIIDVGCGNGTTLSILRETFKDHILSGVEKNDELRGIAERRFENSNVRVLKGDILENLMEEFGKHDIVISQRVIINILNEEDQLRALTNISELVSDRGFLVLVECMKKPLENLNQARSEFGFSAISPSFHNLYLDEEMLENELEAKGFTRYCSESIMAENFLSSHYYVTRVLHDIVLGGREYIRNSHFVKFLSQVIPQDVGDYSPIKFYVFRRK